MLGLHEAADLPTHERANLVAWRPSGTGGLVESFFIKLHVCQDMAFWCRYTLTRRTDGLAYGTLWAILQGGDPPVAIARRYPVRDILFGERRFYLKIGPGELAVGRAQGEVSAQGHSVSWDLAFGASGPSFLHLPHWSLYSLNFPRNKIVSPLVSTVFNGQLTVDGKGIEVVQARGMQGHNYGLSVAPFWAWVHCNIFEGSEDVVFEAITSKVKLGQVLSPQVSAAYLRMQGREWSFNRPDHILKARARVRDMRYELRTACKGVRVMARVHGSMDKAVGLGYVDSDATVRPCLNTNLADMQLEVELGARRYSFQSREGATLELGNLAVPKGFRPLVTG